MLDDVDSNFGYGAGAAKLNLDPRASLSKDFIVSQLVFHFFPEKHLVLRQIS